jgi:hypothetical protein
MLIGTRRDTGWIFIGIPLSRRIHGWQLSFDRLTSLRSGLSVPIQETKQIPSSCELLRRSKKDCIYTLRSSAPIRWKGDEYGAVEKQDLKCLCL